MDRIMNQKIAQLLSISQIQDNAREEKETGLEIKAFNSVQKTGKIKKLPGYT